MLIDKLRWIGVDFYLTSWIKNYFTPKAAITGAEEYRIECFWNTDVQHRDPTWDTVNSVHILL